MKDVAVMVLVSLLVLAIFCGFLIHTADEECRGRADLLGLEAKTVFLGGNQTCVVLVGDRWIPIENYKFTP